MKIYLIKEHKITDKFEMSVIIPIIIATFFFWSEYVWNCGELYCRICSIIRMTITDLAGILLIVAILDALVTIPVIFYARKSRDIYFEIPLEIPFEIHGGSSIFLYMWIIVLLWGLLEYLCTHL